MVMTAQQDQVVEAGGATVSPVHDMVGIAATGDAAEFASRMEQLVDQTRSGDLAAWSEAILVPGELEDRNRAANERDGIRLARATWDALLTLAAESGVDRPPTTTDPTNQQDQPEEARA